MPRPSSEVRVERKKPQFISLLFLTENLQAQSFGRELVFSADFCYNGTNEKPRPLGSEAARGE